jgi:hypothetical protein
MENATKAFIGCVPVNWTGTTGPFGDSVYYDQDDTLYCSWYPIGMCYTSLEDSTNFNPLFIEDREQLIIALSACRKRADALSTILLRLN